MDEFIKSVFFEMFNIGVFRVVDVLSEMLGYLVMIEVFQFEIMLLKNFLEKVGEDVKVVVYVGFGNEFSGYVFFIMDFDDVIRFFDFMMMQEFGIIIEIDEMVQFVIMEMGNILILVYVNVFSEFFGFMIEQIFLEIVIDFFFVIFDFVLVDIGQYCDYMMFFGMVIKVEGIEFNEYFFIFLKFEDMVKVFEKFMGGML